MVGARTDQRIKLRIKGQSGHSGKRKLLTGEARQGKGMRGVLERREKKLKEHCGITS